MSQPYRERTLRRAWKQLHRTSCQERAMNPPCTVETACSPDHDVGPPREQTQPSAPHRQCTLPILLVQLPRRSLVTARLRHQQRRGPCHPCEFRRARLTHASTAGTFCESCRCVWSSTARIPSTHLTCFLSYSC